MTIDHTGNITAANVGGIVGYGAGATMITHSGDIMSSADSVYGRGASVTIETTGNLTASAGHGINAQIASGTGNIMVTHNSGTIQGQVRGIYAKAFGGQITINTTGNISATNFSGIRTSNTTGNTTVTINSGTVTGTAQGVSFSSNAGTTNILNNIAGTITSAGTAVLGGNGNETVNNTGTITGTINFNAGTDTFNNNAGGIFDSGATVASDTVNNTGTWRPRGAGTTGATNVTGNVNQLAGGNTIIDVDNDGSTNDQIAVTGTAALAGTITINLVNSTPADGTTITVLTATGGVTDNGLTLTLPGGVDGFLTVNANDVMVTFGPAAPTTIGADLPNPSPSQQAALTALNNLIATNAPGTQTLITALQGLSPSQLTAALDQLSGETLSNLSVASVLTILGFSNTAFSCKAAVGGYGIIRERECIWVKPGGRWFSHDRTANNLGFKETAWGVTGGAQIALDKVKKWIGGVTVGYEQILFTSSAGRTRVTGRRVQARVTLKYQTGPWLVALGAGGGYGVFESTRTVTFPGFSARPTADFETPFATGRIRIAYLFNGGIRQENGVIGGWYVKPLLDIDVTWLQRSGFTESGSSGAELQVRRSSEVRFAFSPQVEIGAAFQRWGASVRPFLRLGATIFNSANTRTTARFAAAPGSPNFTTTSRSDRFYGTVAAGVDIVRREGFSLKITYTGAFSANSRQHAISGKFIWPF